MSSYSGGDDKCTRSPLRQRAAQDRRRLGAVAAIPPRQRSDNSFASVSIIVPCFNEDAVLGEFHSRLSKVMTDLGREWEVIYVNDGSRDGTLERLGDLRRRDPNISVLNLSRKFGKEIAMTAGLDHSCGDLVIVMDADLQDPPELIPELIETSSKGYDVVFAQRRERQGETWVKKATASGFYGLMQRVGDVNLPPDTGDFRLMSRRAVLALLRMRERHRFMKGLFSWIGYPSTFVLYDRNPRFAGRSSFNYWRLLNLALEGLTSHSVAPLRLASYVGFVVACISILYGGFLFVRTLVLGNPVPGYPSLMTVMLFLGGAQLMTMGILGEYVGRIFNETKGRPLYFVDIYAGSDLSSGLLAKTGSHSATEAGGLP